MQGQQVELTDAVYFNTMLRCVMYRGQIGVAVDANRLAERPESHTRLKNFFSINKCLSFQLQQNFGIPNFLLCDTSLTEINVFAVGR